eukprot:Amastigsp_a362695_12.p4 type:complete len:134 gc:universal Amastigsp_a362695_12:544-143(-)
MRLLCAGLRTTRALCSRALTARASSEQSAAEVATTISWTRPLARGRRSPPSALALATASWSSSSRTRACCLRSSSRSTPLLWPRSSLRAHRRLRSWLGSAPRALRSTPSSRRRSSSTRRLRMRIARARHVSCS